MQTTTAAQQITARTRQLIAQGMRRIDAMRKATYEAATAEAATWRTAHEATTEQSHHWGANPAALAAVGLN